MKPFNLEEAKAGKAVVTKTGLPVRILCFDRKHAKYPIIALIYENDDELMNSYTNEGKSVSNKLESGIDLIMAPDIKTAWIAIPYLNNPVGIPLLSYMDISVKNLKSRGCSEGTHTFKQIQWEE